LHLGQNLGHPRHRTPTRATHLRHRQRLQHPRWCAVPMASTARLLEPLASLPKRTPKMASPVLAPHQRISTMAQPQKKRCHRACHQVVHRRAICHHPHPGHVCAELARPTQHGTENHHHHFRAGQPAQPGWPARPPPTRLARRMAAFVARASGDGLGLRRLLNQ
jgi:hypothetical protein